MITIYGKSDCNWCDRAQELCRQHELNFEYKSVDDRFDGEENMKELKEKAIKENFYLRSVPQIWWGDNYIGGFEQLATEIENTRNYGQEAIL